MGRSFVWTTLTFVLGCATPTPTPPVTNDSAQRAAPATPPAPTRRLSREVTAPFHTFLDQAGVPLVEAKVLCSPRTQLSLKQSRYLSIGSEGCPDWLMPNAEGAGYYRWALTGDDLPMNVRQVVEYVRLCAAQAAAQGEVARKFFATHGGSGPG
jgi:hypothetical protein